MDFSSGNDQKDRENGDLNYKDVPGNALGTDGKLTLPEALSQVLIMPPLTM